MLIRKTIRNTLVLTAITSPFFSQALATQTPQKPELLSKLQTLQCSNDVSTAKKVLNELWMIHNSDYLFPDERVNSEKNNGHLYAGSLDIALDVFAETIEKYPSLQRQVERTFLQWNYCDVFTDGKFYDLKVTSGKLQKKEANYLPPLNWRGFERLGFLNEKATYIPELLINAPIGERAFENFFHRIYRNHCFPHPVTGEMFYKKRRTPPTRLKEQVKEPKTTHYPYAWNKECKTEIATVELPPVIFEVKEEPTPIIEVKEASIQSTPTAPQIAIIEATPEAQSKHSEPEAVPKAEPSLLADLLSNELQDQYRRNNNSSADNTFRNRYFDDNSKAILESLLTGHGIYGSAKGNNDNGLTKGPTNKLNLSVFDRKPKVAPPSVPSGNIPSGATAGLLPRMISENPEESSGFAGGVYLTHALGSESTSVGGSLSWTPIKDSYWNFRVGGNYSLDAKEDPFTYSWGFGYSDWHAGTVSYQLNNYGPIKPGEGLAFDKAVGNIGYSVKSKTLDNLDLRLSGSIDVPVDGDPALNGGLQWSPKENWFIRAGISQPLNGGDPSWSYGFGYSNWRPNKINFAYSNYGPNDLFDTNFKKNGSITINYNWEF